MSAFSPSKCVQSAVVSLLHYAAAGTTMEAVQQHKGQFSMTVHIHNAIWLLHQCYTDLPKMKLQPVEHTMLS